LATGEKKDVRWVQRLVNFQKALDQLTKFIDQGQLSELEEQGLIKAFEYTFELAWTTMKDFLEYRGQTDIFGSRDAIRKSFQLNLIDDGETWMDMLISRNRTSHTYNRETAEEICKAIKDKYFFLFLNLNKTFNRLKSDPDQT
jgi:nucleotidyltransferase substrate binding protein (TIGR01987 family)